MWSHLPHSRGLQTITDPSITLSLSLSSRSLLPTTAWREGGRVGEAEGSMEGGRQRRRQVGKEEKCVCVCVWVGVGGGGALCATTNTSYEHTRLELRG